MGRLLRLLRPARSALAALLLFMVLQVSARPDVRLDASVGFDNNYRAGAWVPLQVRVSDVGADTNGRVQVLVRSQGGTQAYSRPARLRPGAVNGPYTVYYHHPNGAQSKDISIQVTAGGRTLTEKTLDQAGSAVMIPDGQPAIIGLTQDQAGLNFLSQINLNYVHVEATRDPFMGGFNSSYPSGTGRPTYNRVIYPKAAELPDSANGYDAIDVVVLGDLPLDVLTEEQWYGLVGWVKSGGILVVSGSADLNRLRSKLLAEILPITPQSVKQVSSLPSLGYRYEHSPSLKNSAVIVGSLKSDAVSISSQADMPLIAERKLGQGIVVFTAFDMLAPEFRSWQGQAGMWQEIMQRGSGATSVVASVRSATEPNDSSSRSSRDSGNTNRQLTDALAGVQSTEAPSFRSIGLFLLCYILVLVPGNYFLLKRFDKKELAWVTIPAIIFLFSAGAYAVGYKIKGGQLYLHYCSILEGAANTDGWQAYSVGSIFSPRQARYDMSVADPAALVMEVTGGGANQRGDNLVVERDQKTVVKGALVNMWDHRQFDFSSFVTLGGQLSASVTPGSGNTASVSISNSTRMPLHDCSISYGTAQALVGDLAPGEAKTVRISLNNAAPSISVIAGQGRNSKRAVKEIRDALAELVASASSNVPMAFNVSGQPVQAVRKTPFVFTGWFDNSAVGLALENDQPVVSGANLLVVHLPSPEGTGQAAAPPPVPPRTRRDPFAGQGFTPGQLRGIRAPRLSVMPPQQSTNSAASNAPLIRLAPGQPTPQVPQSGKGSRRILQSLQGGGHYLITQEWDHSSGRSSSSSSTAFLPPGSTLPK